MIVAGSANPLLLASAAGGYNLTNSLRFRGSASAYLNRTFTTPTDNKKWTWSAWVKLGTLSTGRILFCVDVDANNRAQLQMGSGNTLAFDQLNAGSFDGVTSTVAVYRDPSAWYHVMFVFDSANATASLRNRYYINGVEQAYNDSVTIPQNTASKINSAISHKIGRNTVTSSQFDGYMTEVNFVDGQALTPSSFGETNTKTGVWQPKKYIGTYGTNGFYLPFTDNSALTTSSNVGLGKDFSGNGNYFTTNNISITAGATYDSMTDVPTLTSATAANYCVMNPLSTVTGYNAFTYTAGNLNVSSGNVSTFMAGTSSMQTPSTGKFYWEATVTAVTTFGDMFIGLYNSSAAYPAAYRDAGSINNLDGAAQTSGSTYTAGDIIGVAVDSTNGTVQFYKNNVAQGSTPSLTFTAGTPLLAYMGSDNNAGEIAASWNFGQRPFAYTPPTGFVALNTFNLPTPTIGATASTQANDYFNVVTYTGNDVNGRSVTGFGFNPDFVWVKSRSITENNVLSNTVTGGGQTLYSNLTIAEQTNEAGGYIASFVTDGFTVSAGGVSDNAVNNNGTTYVSWAWRASNATAVTNTAGSITSTVSANTSAGFSVVTYTGTGANATVGHGLGVAPKMIIVKSRSAVTNWIVYHSNIGNTGASRLNAAFGTFTDSTYWNNTSPTSTVFTVGTDGGVNTSSATYVAYCFSEVAGYSKFGSYTGNGSTDGAFVYTGFRPRFVLFKCFTNSGTYWVIIDAARNTSNLANTQLFPNATDADTTGGSTDQPIDILSNGFKLRGTGGAGNESGQSYLYMAFAENPFKYSLAR